MIRITWLTPRMDRLFTEAPSERRRFLDRLVIGLEPGHGRNVAAYRRAVRERIVLLRDGTSDHDWLSALEASIAEHGVAVAAARRDTVARLRGALADGIGPFPKADLSVSGLVESWLREMPALEAEEAFRNHLSGMRATDAESGMAVSGPHRSDLVVHHASKGLPAQRCSTGEQKALVIAIVLASLHVQAALAGSVPLLLLDEIAAHLDEAHRSALFDELGRLGVQAWLTGTDPRLFDELNGSAQFFDIGAGSIRSRR